MQATFYSSPTSERTSAHTTLRGGSTRLKPYGCNRAQESARGRMLSPLLRIGSIPTLHLKNFKELFWRTTWRNNWRKAQWQTQSRYLCPCAFLVSFCYAGSEKTWPNHFISISLGGTPSVISLALRMDSIKNLIWLERIWMRLHLDQLTPRLHHNPSATASVVTNFCGYYVPNLQ